ncbi:PLC-like phosphodiesterase [Xylariomycetidae sp. FL0641]|nr:PLC-like phosphodiesterase [Xylariomycetidae sp. FL0641]
MSSILASLNPFGNAAPEGDDEAGEQIDEGTFGGGGQGLHHIKVPKRELRVSHALKSFLVHHNALSEEDADLDSPEPSEPVRALLAQPHINVPQAVTDRSHPLPEYFISSSHNTYLVGHQLQGQSDVSAYRVALSTGARCVEIDAWDDDDDKEEPKVTHGYTLVSHIPFRAVCQIIRDVVDMEAMSASDAQGYRAAPIMLSLENHCGHYGQERLVAIMKEVWGDRLLSKPVRDKGTEEQEVGDTQVTLDDLGSKIVLIVEYHLPDEPDSSSSSSSDSSSDEEGDDMKRLRAAYKTKKKETAKGGIIPELAELGVYAQSVKPVNNSWFEDVLSDGPHHHLINVSETGLKSLMPSNNEKIAQHNAQFLMRVFPKGTRISSTNLQPVPYWGLGAQICAMNWQTFGASMQLNEALFGGTEGYVLKPQALRAGGSGTLKTGQQQRLRLHVAGVTDVPIPEDRSVDDIKPYVTCSLYLPSHTGEHPKARTKGYHQHKLTGFLHRGENPPVTEPVWDETLEWEIDEGERDLAFLRILLKSEDSFSVNPVFAVAAICLRYVEPDAWRFVRLLNLKGHETGCTVLVRFSFENA